MFFAWSFFFQFWIFGSIVFSFSQKKKKNSYFYFLDFFCWVLESLIWIKNFNSASQHELAQVLLPQCPRFIFAITECPDIMNQSNEIVPFFSFCFSSAASERETGPRKTLRLCIRPLTQLELSAYRITPVGSNVSRPPKKKKQKKSFTTEVVSEFSAMPWDRTQVDLLSHLSSIGLFKNLESTL